MEKICVVFCEGQHDIAFVSRILKVNGYSVYNNKIKQFLKPFDTLFKKQLEEKNVSDRKLGFNPDYRLPSVSLSRNDERLVFFHNMGGDGKVAERATLIKMYREIKGDDDFTAEFTFDFRFIFLFDSDDHGIDARIRELNTELGFGRTIENGRIAQHEGHEWGAYIFHQSGNDQGDLEDIIIDIVNTSEPIILEQSQLFLNGNSLPPARTKEFICTHEEVSYKPSIKYKHKKSLLSVAGQLQFSGMSNAVFIANSDFLTLQQLTENEHCSSIANLFV